MKYFTDYSTDELSHLLESADEQAELMILLEVAELNLLDQMEQRKVALDNFEKKDENEEDDEDEDDLLYSHSSPKSLEAQANEKRALEESIKDDNALLSRLREIITAIQNRPKDFLGEHGVDKINKDLDRNLIPKDKKKRSAQAKKIIEALIKTKVTSKTADKGKISLSME